MTENFSLDKINAFHTRTEFEQAKEYLCRFFYPLTNNNHALSFNGKFEILDNQSIKQTYFARMSPELNKFNFKEYTKLKTVDYQIGKPLIFDDKLNLCPTFKHQYVKYDTMSNDTKKKVNVFLNYIKEIICDNKTDHYEYVLKWTANMVKGNKNDACLYFKGIQGAGKSTFGTFIMKHVIGDDLCLETGSEPIKTHFNSILGGKLFVIFEELENVSVSEWNAMSSRLKRQITSTDIDLESKGINRYKARNLNNYIICSNNDAIKDEEGRRYYCADISTKRVSDFKYWDQLYDCMNDEVGLGVYCYLMEINTDNFKPQEFPLTNNKVDAISKRLDSAYKFLRDNYILRKKSINTTVGDLFNEYVSYCKDKEIKAHHKIDFNKLMSNQGIIYTKSGPTNKYNVSSSFLSNIAKRNNWIHELDEVANNDDNVEIEDSTQELARLLNESKEINERIKELVNEKQLKVKPKTIQEDVKMLKKKMFKTITTKTDSPKPTPKLVITTGSKRGSNVDLIGEMFH